VRGRLRRGGRVRVETFFVETFRREVDGSENAF